MNSVQATMMQANMRAEIQKACAQTIESILCDYAAFYRGTETASLEEIRDGLGILMDKLQTARREASEAAESTSRLAQDLMVRLRKEADEATG